MKFWTKNIPPEQVWTVPDGVSIRVLKEGEPYDLISGERLGSTTLFEKLTGLLCGETHPHLYCLMRGPEHAPLVFSSREPLDIPGVQEVTSLPSLGRATKPRSLLSEVGALISGLLETEKGWDKIIASMRNPLQTQLQYRSLARQCLEVKHGPPLWFKGGELTQREIRTYLEHSTSISLIEAKANPKRALDDLLEKLVSEIAWDEDKTLATVLQQASPPPIVENPAARSLPGCLQKAFDQFRDQRHIPRHILLPLSLSGRFDQETGLSKLKAKLPYTGKNTVYGCQIHPTLMTPFLTVLGEPSKVGEFHEEEATWKTSSFPHEHHLLFTGVAYMRLKKNPAIVQIVPSYGTTTEEEGG